MDKKEVDSYVNEKSWRKKVYEEAVKQQKQELAEKEEKKKANIPEKITISRRQSSYLEPSKVLSPEEYKQYKKHRVEKRRLKLLEDIRREKPMTRAISRISRYEGSKSGAVSRGIQKGFKFIKSPARALYLTPEERVGDYSGTKPQRMNAIALWRARQAQQERIRMQQQQAQAAAQERQRYNDLFWAGSIAANTTEKEVCSSNGGLTWQGANTANICERQAFNTAAFAISPVRNVEAETNLFSGNIDAWANLSIDNEVISFANNPFGIFKRRR